MYADLQHIIDLLFRGEYRGEGPWYIFAVVGIAFAIFTVKPLAASSAKKGESRGNFWFVLFDLMT